METSEDSESPDSARADPLNVPNNLCSANSKRTLDARESPRAPTQITPPISPFLVNLISARRKKLLSHLQRKELEAVDATLQQPAVDRWALRLPRLLHPDAVSAAKTSLPARIRKPSSQDLAIAQGNLWRVTKAPAINSTLEIARATVPWKGDRPTAVESNPVGTAAGQGLCKACYSGVCPGAGAALIRIASIMCSTRPVEVRGRKTQGAVLGHIPLHFVFEGCGATSASCSKTCTPSRPHGVYQRFTYQEAFRKPLHKASRFLNSDRNSV